MQTIKARFVIENNLANSSMFKCRNHFIQFKLLKGYGWCLSGVLHRYDYLRLSLFMTNC